MVSINLFQSGKFDLEINFPSTWNDLLPEEIIFIAKTLLEETDSNSARGYIYKHIVEARAGNRPLPEDWFLSHSIDDLIIYAFPLLDFIFKQNDLTNDPEPVVIGKETYYPQSWSDITCGEYEDSEVFATEFAADPSGKSLASLAAILFRPKAPSAYKDASILMPPPPEGTGEAEHLQKKFLALPSERLYAIFIWYAGNRAQLPMMFPDVYDGTGTEEKDLMAFTKCIHAGAGPKNGTRQQIRITRLFEFMFDMNEESKKAKELEAEYQRMSNK